MFNSEKVFVLLRATSGCGKSSLANYLIKNAWAAGKTAIECNTDTYHMVDGIYKFDPNKLGWAHNQCFEKFKQAVLDGYNLIIQSNTNCAEREFKHYQDFAEQNGYTFISLILEHRHDGVNLHSVSPAGLQKQENKLRNSLKFL